jgi:phosphatidylinositol 4-kinase type 2
VSAGAFAEVVAAVRAAIAAGVQPTRIAQGSSGSYFCRALLGGPGQAGVAPAIVAVFKPKSEEPYARHNPKWGKWIQRTCCPFFFGRGWSAVPRMRARPPPTHAR